MNPAARHTRANGTPLDSSASFCRTKKGAPRPERTFSLGSQFDMDY